MRHLDLESTKEEKELMKERDQFKSLMVDLYKAQVAKDEKKIKAINISMNKLSVHNDQIIGDSVKGIVQFSWGGGLYDNSKRELIGVFRTKEEALEMRKILDESSLKDTPLNHRMMRYEMIDSDNWQEYLERFVK